MGFAVPPTYNGEHEQQMRDLDELEERRAEIRKIVREELDRRAWDNLKAIYPPEFVQGLEEVFRGLQRDSHVFSAPPHQRDFCPHCEVSVRHGNFCSLCGTKLHDSCECWVLEKPFNCGQAECPGLNLFIDPKLKSLLPQPQDDKKSV